MKVTFPIMAYATVETPFDSSTYTWEELADWLYENAVPAVRYGGYNLYSGYVCIPDLKVTYEVDEEMFEFTEDTTEVETCHEED